MPYDNVLTLNHVWTTDGLLERTDSGVCLRYPILVQPFATESISCEPEQPVGDNMQAAVRAGLLELVARIGLESLFVPLPTFGKVVTDKPINTKSRVSGGGLQTVVGWSPDWIKGILTEAGASQDEFLSTFDMLREDEGLLYLIGSGILIVSGKSRRGILSAMRALASSPFEPSETCFVARGDVDADPTVVSAVASTGTRSSIPALHNLFVSKGTGSEEPLLPETDVQFSRFVDLDSVAFEAVLSLIARVGLESGSLQFPVARFDFEPARESALQFHFTLNPTDSAGTVAQTHQGIEFKAPTYAVLSQMLNDIVDSWFDEPNDVTMADWRGKVAALTSEAPDICLRAETEVLLTSRHQGNRQIVGLTVPSHLLKTVEPWCAANRVPLHVDDDPLLFDMEWRGQSEWQRMQESLVADLVHFRRELGHPAQKFFVEVFTTVSQEAFEKDVEKLFTHLMCSDTYKLSGKVDSDSIVFLYRNVAKAGLSWFMGDVMPSLRGNPSVASIEIAAKRVPEDAGYLDLPQRLLQEFFPIDAILEKEIGLPSTAVKLSLYDEPDVMYKVTALDAAGDVVGYWEWNSLTEHRPYMPGDAETSVIAPAAGYRLSTVDRSDGHLQTVMERQIPTVYTEFWDWYQNEVISKIVSSYSPHGGPTVFSRLEVELCVDCSEERHGVYEEVVSWPEAIHEDIYFYTLDALRKHGARADEEIWRTPGLIVPLIHIKVEAPHAQVRLFTYSSNQIYVRYQGGSEHSGDVDVECIAVDRLRTPFCADSVRTLTYRSGHWTVDADGVASSDMADESSEANRQSSSVDSQTGAVLVWLNTTSTQRQDSHLVKESIFDLPGLPISEDDNDIGVLQNNDVIRWLNESADVLPGRHWVVDYSFHGRPIVGIELYEPLHNCLTSRQKHLLFKPTFLILARHHANEVSSTNSALVLIRKLIDKPEHLRQYNVIVVPVHNTDGAALHRRLMDEHPYWKHHAARFNACGYEFGHDYFKTNTPFGESRVAARLWDRWKPDIILDDHGIPSHEWIQPFSGYNSPPSFPVSYWIPHAQMYTIWRELNPESQLPVDGLALTVSRALSADAQIRERNAEFLHRYIKWGETFSPQKFPVTTVDGVITYRWKEEARPATSTNFMGRYPNWVTADMITEVNDETVHGEALREVVHAHSKVHDGVVEWLSQIEIAMSQTHEQNGAAIRIGLVRRRPLA